jgi:nucleoside-diphosphate-sugar epimerase
MGSSRDGAAANFNGMAQFLKVLDNLARAGRQAGAGTGVLRVPCAAGATKNIVTVDWVASSLRRLIEQPRPGGTYHLTHPRPLTHAQLQEVLGEVLGWKDIEIREDAAGREGAAGFCSAVLRGVLRHFEPYLWGEPTFDRSHLERDLVRAAEPPPVDRAYLERVIAFGRKVAWSSRPLEAQARSWSGAPSPEGRKPCVRS